MSRPTTYSVQPVTPSDVPEMAEIMVAALQNDEFWTGLKGSMTHEEEYKFTHDTMLPRFTKGAELDASEGWKVVDENGKILGWAGLGKPITLTPEQSVAVTTTYEFPAKRNEGLYDVWQNQILASAAKNGYDPTKHFQRQNSMVRPDYQRQGIGRLLTEKCNEIADRACGITYVRARPNAAALFIQMGYEILERIDFDLSDYGAVGGKTSTFAMKREPGAISEKGKKVDWS